MILEVISTSPQDSRTIEECGAHRIELVSALEIGGLTPSTSILRKSLQAVSIPTNVIIRHHNNSFHYTSQEKELLLQDIQHCKDLKVSGIVIGAIKEDKSIDEEFLQQVKNQVGSKMTITFHKASDHTPNLINTINILQEYQVDTVLTQGGINPIVQNYDTLKKVINKYAVKVLLGGGITHENIKSIIAQLQPSQIHVGTAVRINKYGPVSSEKVIDFLSFLK